MFDFEKGAFTSHEQLRSKPYGLKSDIYECVVTLVNNNKSHDLP